jgi:single-stranded-DNA-specific exonuclease
MKEVIYTKRKIDINSPTYLEYSNGITVNSGRSIVGYLPEQTENILKNLTYNYNFKFKVEITDIIKKDENYNIHIVISRDYSFTSNSFKPTGILKDIKNYILGDLEYNSLQKKVLSTIFRSKENPLVIYSGNRGMKSIIATMGLWNQIHGKKVLVITDENLPSYLGEFVEASPNYKDGYDYYIFYNKLPIVELGENFMVITTEDIHIKNTKKIVDTVSVPTNIEILEEFDLINSYDKSKTYYSKKLSMSKRKHIIENLDKFEKIYGTDDILRVL